MSERQHVVWYSWSNLLAALSKILVRQALEMTHPVPKMLAVSPDMQHTRRDQKSKVLVENPKGKRLL
jgi:hypothetical protein